MNWGIRVVGPLSFHHDEKRGDEHDRSTRGPRLRGSA